jgi:hypothetical protein
MAVSIDTVYQRVLATINKEQRGYVTPIEFNLLANQAQLAIFEQYFYDLDQAKRKPSEVTSFSDMPELIKNKLTSFTSIATVTGGVTFPVNYRVGKIFWNDYTLRKITANELRNINRSPWHKEYLHFDPVYIEGQLTGEDIRAYNGLGQITAGVTCEIITKPGKVEWAYDVVAEKALYNPNYTTNFFLHSSEETNLVIKILELSGIVIQDPGVITYADREGVNKIQQEKL